MRPTDFDAWIDRCAAAWDLGVDLGARRTHVRLQGVSLLEVTQRALRRLDEEAARDAAIAADSRVWRLVWVDGSDTVVERPTRAGFAGRRQLVRRLLRGREISESLERRLEVEYGEAFADDSSNWAQSSWKGWRIGRDLDRRRSTNHAAERAIDDD